MARLATRTSAVLATALAAFVATITGRAEAQEFFEAPRDFVIDKPCSAFRSFKRQSGATALEVGRAYSARGENRRNDPSHVFLRVGEESKWAALGCGHFSDGGAGARVGVDGSSANSSAATTTDRAAGQCLPFFDLVDNPVAIGVGGTVDVTPPPPSLDAFDRAVNSLCGAAGTVVAEGEFKAMMRANPDVLERVRAYTGSRVFAVRPVRDTQAAFLDDLTDAWFAVKAFDHIMCGEPGSGRKTIGGLHFYGRYLQLQETGEACRMANHRQNEAVPGVLYTFGVVMKTKSGGIRRHARKGYGLTLSAEDLMKAATLAFAENPTSKLESSACMLPIKDDGKEFTAVFVRRANGIRTFYPDATPSTRDPACRNAIELQGR